MAKDHYETLGVGRNASKDEIKRAYKKLAKEYHPDLHNDKIKEEKFKEINEAYKVLSDDKARSNYDRFGTAGAGQGFQGFSGFGQGFGDETVFDFGDIFDNFFGGGMRSGSAGSGGRGRTRRGSDLQHELTITLEEAYAGVKKTIRYRRLASCDECGGTGAEDGKMNTCSTCSGTGYVKVSRRMPFGVFQTTSPCRDCNGDGKTAASECTTCNGTGAIEKDESIEISVPAGIDHMQALKVAGKGYAAKNGHAGDLYVVVKIKPHKIFTRKGEDIICEIPINFATAVLGGKIEVPTLDGDVELKIPQGTQPGTIFRFKGRGMPSMRGYSVGNQLCRVTVDVPKKVNKRQKEILQEFSDMSKDAKPRKSLFEKIRDAL